MQRTKRIDGTVGLLFGAALACGLGCASGRVVTSCGETIPRPSSLAVEQLATCVAPESAAESWIAEIDRAIDEQDRCRGRR